MAKQWGVGILGLGHWYSAYGLARALPEYSRARLVAVAWPDQAQREAFSETFRVPGHEAYEALLERDDVEIVHLATPVAQLPEWTIRAAEAGKHIVLGKPMAMRVAEADRMVEAVEAAGVTCVPFQSLARLRAAALKKRIDKGEIGDLILMHQTGRWSIAEDWYHSGTPGWFADPEQVPGGAFIDEGIYWLDLLRWLAGSEVRQVHARMANLVHRNIEVEDWGLAMLTFESGLMATLEASWTINAPRKTGPSPKQNSVVRLEVIGTEGEIIDQWFRAPGRAVLASGADDWVFERQVAEPFAQAVPLTLDHLVACLEHGRPPVTTIAEARDTFRVAMAAYDSAREGRTVHLF